MGGAVRASDDIAITPTTADDLADLRRLWNDGRVMRWVQFPDGLGIDEPGLWRWLELTDADPHRHHFVVRANGTFCGEVFYAVDGRRAELDIKLVPEAQGRGVATHALTWLVDHAFDHEPAVDEVWTEPWPENAPARALYVRCGLVERQRPPELRPGPSFFSRRR